MSSNWAQKFKRKLTIICTDIIFPTKICITKAMIVFSACLFNITFIIFFSYMEKCGNTVCSWFTTDLWPSVLASLLTFWRSQQGKLQMAIMCNRSDAATDHKYEPVAKSPDHDHMTMKLLGWTELGGPVVTKICLVLYLWTVTEQMIIARGLPI